MSKLIAIDKDTCINCGLCPSEAPDVFEIKNNGYAEIILKSKTENIDGLIYYAVDSSMLEDVNFSIEGCPTESIKKLDA